VVLVGGVAAGLTYLLAPDSLARLHGRFLGPPLQIAGLELFHGRDEAFLSPGGALEVKPDVPLRVGGLRTNRWRDYDLALVSPDLDLARLSLGAASLVDLLGENYFLEPRILKLEVREGPELRAVFSLKAAFTAADWAFRGDSAVEPERRIGYYRLALALEPELAEVKESLVAALAEAGRDLELAEFWEAELGLSEGPARSVDILARLLPLYRGLGDRDGEIRTLERLLALGREAGRPVEPILGALAALFRGDRPADSAKLYEEILTTAEPSRRRAYLGELAAIYERLGDVAGQIGVWERLLDHAAPEEIPAVWYRLVALRGEAADEAGLRAALEGLAASLPDGPEKADAYRRLGNVWLEGEDPVQAAKAFEEASRLDPDDVVLILNLARLGAARGDREAYRSHLERALAVEPSTALTMELAQALDQDGLDSRAAELWLGLARKAGDDPETVATRKEAGARLLHLLRPRRGFSEEFESRLFELSDNAVEFYNLAVARFKAKHWKQAEKAFQRAMELDRGGALDSDIRGYLLALYQASGQHDNMVAQAMRLYQADPSKKIYRDLVLDRFETTRDWAGLAGAAGEWTKWRPEDPDNWRFLALGQRNAGRAAEAAKSLLRVAEVEKTKVASWMAAAEALERSGEKQAAVTAYERVVELQPSNAKAEKALLRLALDGLAKGRGTGG
jgi:tetratricopeptide (TPR) repeat protein